MRGAISYFQAPIRLCGVLLNLVQAKTLYYHRQTEKTNREKNKIVIATISLPICRTEITISIPSLLTRCDRMKQIIEEYHILGCDVVQSGRILPTFLRNPANKLSDCTVSYLRREYSSHSAPRRHLISKRADQIHCALSSKYLNRSWALLINVTLYFQAVQ